MRPPSPSIRTAFTLIELLAVMSIIVIMVAFVVPAVSNFGRSTGLVAAGNMIVNLASSARQTAMTKNTLTALVLLANQGSDDDFRAVTVLEYNTVSGWVQSTQWQHFAPGVVVDSDPANSSFLLNSAKFPFLNYAGRPPQPDPPVSYDGKPLNGSASVRARIFLPSGGLQNAESAAQIRLVEGFRANGTTVVTNRGSGGTSANYYDVAIVPATGMTKISRP